MSTIKDLSFALRCREAKTKLTRAAIGARTGLTQTTLRNVLDGKGDFKISNLLAVAKELGLDVVLMPSEAASAIAESGNEPMILSGPQAAIERMHQARLQIVHKHRAR